VRRFAAALIIVMAGAACDGNGGETTTLPTGSTSSTTAATEVCADLADEAVDLIEDMVEELENVSYEQLVDRAQWPDDLVSLEERGSAIDAEAVAAGCDPGPIQRAVADAIAQVDAEGGVSELLVELISP
jgi:hypothetical protein